MKKVLYIIIVFQIIFLTSCSSPYNGNNRDKAGTKAVNTAAIINDTSEKSTDPVKISTKEFNESSEFMETNIKIPVIEGLKEQQIQSKINDFIQNDAIKFKNDIEIQAKSDLEYSKKQGWQFNPYSAYINFSVSYNKNNILSMPITYESYTGGAHGMTVIISRNIDLKTGKDILLKDIFKEGVDYRTIIINEIQRQIKDKPDEYFEGALEDVKKLADTQPFYIVDDGFVIYYGLYELAPYAGGIREFKIPYSLFSDGVKEEFLN